MITARQTTRSVMVDANCCKRCSSSGMRASLTMEDYVLRNRKTNPETFFFALQLSVLLGLRAN